jgi:hypothetical protein
MLKNKQNDGCITLTGISGEGLTGGKKGKYKIKRLKFKVIFHGRRPRMTRRGRWISGWNDLLVAISSSSKFLSYKHLKLEPEIEPQQNAEIAKINFFGFFVIFAAKF